MAGKEAPVCRAYGQCASGKALRPSFTRVALVPASPARATPRQGPGKTACNEHVSAHLPAAIGKVRGRCLPCVSMATGIHSRRRCGGGGPTSGTATEGIQKWLPTSATCSDNKYYEVAAKWATSSTAGRRRALRQRGQRGPDQRHGGPETQASSSSRSRGGANGSAFSSAARPGRDGWAAAQDSVQERAAVRAPLTLKRNRGRGAPGVCTLVQILALQCISHGRGSLRFV